MRERCRKRGARKAPLLAALILVLAPIPPRAAGPGAARGVEACRPCHGPIVESYRTTAHFLASRPADARSVLGRFDEAANVLRTRVTGTFFKMEARQDGLYQTAFQKERPVRRERFDLVIGSGRRGQSYLYWKGGLLFQLPVSFLSGAEAWANSPGYPDGVVHFDRPIPPRCLDCHATFFRLEGKFPDARYASDHALGIACQRCHLGDAGHDTIRNPARFPRDRKVDLCALCHSGIREQRTGAFSYVPGEPLGSHLGEAAKAEPDVHGNQVGLLARSRCFASSRSMSCSSCHDVHRPERDPIRLSQKCLACHRPKHAGFGDRIGDRLEALCIDCHMPKEPSRVIRIEGPGAAFAQTYRTHAIAVYRDRSEALLGARGPKRD